MVVSAKWLGPEAVTVPLLEDGRVEPGEVAHFPGEVVDDDPNAAADAILIEREDGTRHALPLTLWEPQGAAGTIRTIPQVLADVDGDPERARAALTLEQRRIKPRSTLVATLERIGGMDPLGPGGTPAASELPPVEPNPSQQPDPAADPNTEV